MRLSQWRFATYTMLAIDLVAVGTARADWPSDPAVNVPICTAKPKSANPSMAPDLASGAFIA
jgi:hypothetical protein